MWWNLRHIQGKRRPGSIFQNIRARRVRNWRGETIWVVVDFDTAISILFADLKMVHGGDAKF